MTLATNIPGNRWDLIEQNPVAPDMKVSVIIPCLHDKNTLGVVLKSLFYQTYPRYLIEIIIVCQQDLSIKNIPTNARIIIADERTTDLRHVGALNATGEILLFIDDDTILDTECIYNHAAWHHRIDNGFVIGRLQFIYPYAVIESDLPNILYDLKNNRSDLKIMDSSRAQFLSQTCNLTKSNSEDIFSYTNINNMSIRTENYHRVGGLSKYHDRINIINLGFEFGFRVYQHGCMFIPLQPISGWRLGKHDIVETIPTIRSKILTVKQYIAHPIYRPNNSRRNYKIPSYVVHVEVDSVEIAIPIIEDILSNDPYDLVICVSVSPKMPQMQNQMYRNRILLDFQYDGRVQFGKSNILDEYPTAPFHIYIKTSHELRNGIMLFLIKKLKGKDIVRFECDDRCSQIYIARTRFLHRQYDFNHNINRIAVIETLPLEQISKRKIPIWNALSGHFKLINNKNDIYSLSFHIAKKLYAILKNICVTPSIIITIINVICSFNLSKIQTLFLYLAIVRDKNLLYAANQGKICSHRYKFIYVRTPKVASSSIISVLQKIDPTLMIYNTTLDNLYEQYPETKEYFIFTFMRHPLSRIISCWRNKIMQQDKYNIYVNKHYGLYDNMDLASFCTWICSRWGSDRFADSHWISQSQLFYSSYKSRPDFIGKYENLNEDWRNLSQMLGIPHVALPLHNQSVDRLDTMNLPTLLLEKIHKRYQRDYEIGEY